MGAQIYSTVLYLFLATCFASLRADEQAQGGPFPELLAQGGLKDCLEARFDVLPGEGRGHRDG